MGTVRVAIVHDWLTGMRGGERVLEVFCEEFPGADIFTLVYLPENVSATIRAHRVVPSWIDSLPWARRRHQIYLALFPRAVESFDLRGYDLVLSSSHCVAKGAKAPDGVRHLCYCYTPVRYAYEFYDVYRRSARPPWIGPLVFGASVAWLRRWDQATAGRPDAYAAISETVRARIERHYGREAEVVYPPVNEAFYVPDGAPAEDWYLVLSALVPYKRVDLAIEAFRLLGLPLKVIGEGPERRRLEARAPANVEFLGRLSDEEVRSHLQRCRALIFPGVEDFGITPLEANACGRPVVAFREGGATETLEHGRTGWFFDAPEAEALASAVDVSRGVDFDARHLRANAERFGRERFRADLRAWLARHGVAP